MSARDNLEYWLNRAWYGPAPWTYILVPLIPFVWLYVASKRALRPASQPSELGAPVIVVGGITVGGTGKTPTLIALAQWLTGNGLLVGVVSRGYGRRNPKAERLVDVNDSATIAGDEPLLIKKAIPEVNVMVTSSRRSGASRLISEYGVDVVLADDGLQHYALPRDFEICVLDAKRYLGNNKLLPVGPLRETKSRLETVDFVLIRNGANPSSALYYAIEGIRHHVTSERLTVEEFLSRFAERSVIAATGLGQPEQFFLMLRDYGFSFEEEAVADHSVLPVQRINRSHVPAAMLITEKDAVKLDPIACDNVWVVELAARLPDALKNKVAGLLDQKS